VRGNGLSAAAYVAVADLEPDRADALLVVLADRGVAAYAAQSPEADPEGELDRLYVDVAAVEQARALVEHEFVEADSQPPAVSPDPFDDLALDVDTEFAAIVSDFHSAVARRGSWPADEDLDPDPHPGPAPVPVRPVTGWEDLLRPLPEPEPEPEEGYVPPPPPPLPEIDLVARFAWTAVLGGPAVLFAAVLLGWQLPDWAMLLAAVAFVGGFVTLVVRLGDRPDDDDGAVV
jgi:hypothetical protein